MTGEKIMPFEYYFDYYRDMRDQSVSKRVILMLNKRYGNSYLKNSYLRTEQNRNGENRYLTCFLKCGFNIKDISISITKKGISSLSYTLNELDTFSSRTR